MPTNSSLRHRLERVVVAPLDADRRDGVGREVLAAERARAVAGVHERLVRQRQQLLVQRVVEHRRRAPRPSSRATPRRSGRPTSPMKSVSPVRTAYGRAPARASRGRGSRSIPASGPASRAPRGGPSARARSHRRRHRPERVLGLAAGTEVDLARRSGRAAPGGRRRSPRGSASGTTWRISEPARGRVGQVLIDVALGIDDRRDPALLVRRRGRTRARGSRGSTASGSSALQQV